MATLFYTPSPFGRLALVEQDGSITGLFLPQASIPPDLPVSETPLLLLAAKELEEYFTGSRVSFDLPLAPQGTPFQTAVWRALLTIPYGKTRSYQEIAIAVGNPQAARAVGMANHANPLPILIPCHRVIRKSGAYGGYGGGKEIKQALLELEQKVCHEKP